MEETKQKAIGKTQVPLWASAIALIITAIIVGAVIMKAAGG